MIFKNLFNLLSLVNIPFLQKGVSVDFDMSVNPIYLDDRKVEPHKLIAKRRAIEYASTRGFSAVRVSVEVDAYSTLYVSNFYFNRKRGISQYNDREGPFLTTQLDGSSIDSLEPCSCY